MRQFITPGSIAATIRMLRATFQGSFLLVEGDADSRLYGRLVDRSVCHVQVCMNRAMVICVVKILNTGGFVGHLGIIDKDHAPLLNEALAIDNLISTDENDIELTILCSDTLDRFLHEYGNPDKIKAFENEEGRSLLDILVNHASTIGALLLLSKQLGWNLNFEDMRFRFAGRNTVAIDLDQQINALRGRSQGAPMPDSNNTIRAAVDAARVRHASTLALVRGRDVCEVLSKGIHDVFGRSHHNLSRRGLAVEEVIRAAYSRENFQQTQLYREIRAWEARHAPLRVL